MRPHSRHLAAAIVIFLAALAGYWFWYNALSAESAAVADMKSQVDVKTAAAARIASARAALSEIAGDEAALQNYFVPGTGVVAFIDGLEATGKAQGAAVNVLSVSTGTIGTQPAFLFTVTVTGTFDAVMRTVGAIEYAPYDLSISQLSFSQDNKNSWHANLDLRVASLDAAATSTPNISNTP